MADHEFEKAKSNFLEELSFVSTRLNITQNLHEEIQRKIQGACPTETSLCSEELLAWLKELCLMLPDAIELAQYLITAAEKAEKLWKDKVTGLKERDDAITKKERRMDERERAVTKREERQLYKLVEKLMEREEEIKGREAKLREMEEQFKTMELKEKKRRLDE